LFGVGYDELVVHAGCASGCLGQKSYRIVLGIELNTSATRVGHKHAIQNGEPLVIVARDYGVERILPFCSGRSH
jgi:hypothetical protein